VISPVLAHAAEVRGDPRSSTAARVHENTAHLQQLMGQGRFYFRPTNFANRAGLPAYPGAIVVTAAGGVIFPRYGGGGRSAWSRSPSQGSWPGGCGPRTWWCCCPSGWLPVTQRASMIAPQGPTIQANHG
jgi:hypothetical protein